MKCLNWKPDYYDENIPPKLNNEVYLLIVLDRIGTDQIGVDSVHVFGGQPHSWNNKPVKIWLRAIIIHFRNRTKKKKVHRFTNNLQGLN